MNQFADPLQSSRDKLLACLGKSTDLDDWLWTIARHERVRTDRARVIVAAAHGFIQRLPHGYDTVIGERGATLSAGETQRLSIARALLKDVPVLILDEPTSAMDATTEATLLDTFEWLTRGRTTLVIAHRLSTIHCADRIVVLEVGRVVEVGTHSELRRSNGLYQTCCNLQSEPSPDRALPDFSVPQRVEVS